MIFHQSEVTLAQFATRGSFINQMLSRSLAIARRARSVAVGRVSQALETVKVASCVSFSSSANATAVRNPAHPASRLLRQLDVEIGEQRRVIEESGEDMSPQAVLEGFSEVVGGAGGWQVSDAPGQALVTMTRRDPALNGTLTVRFNLSEVINGSSMEFDQDEYDEEEEEGDESEETKSDIEARQEEGEGEFEDDSPGYASFSVTVELVRDSLPDKKLVFDCMAEAAEDSPTLTVENVAILSTDMSTDGNATYNGPDYSTLDEDLRGAFDKFIEKTVKPAEMVSFISAYAQAKEANEYQSWLEQAKAILAK